MAASTSNGFPIPETAKQATSGQIRLVKRRISLQAGHALEILGHAIDYLIDQGEADGNVLDMKGGRDEAIRLLMAINRQIYFECPEVPTLVKRLHSLLRFLGA
jgi:hypothetical protein